MQFKKYIARVVMRTHSGNLQINKISLIFLFSKNDAGSFIHYALSLPEAVIMVIFFN